MTSYVFYPDCKDQKAKAKSPIAFFLLGDTGVGKSSLLAEKFSDEYQPTVCVNQYITTQEWRDCIAWDSSGHEMYAYAVNPRLSTANVDAVVFVFDLTNKESLTNIKKIWLPLVQKKKANSNNLLFLVANKSDLVDQRQVLDEEARNFAVDNNMQYIEMSAKLNRESLNDMLSSKIANVIILQKGRPVVERKILNSDEEKLKKRLENYISRIDKNKDNHSNPNFFYNFTFFRKSRALNRVANYLLAKKLLEELKDKPMNCMKETFNKVNDYRNEILNAENLNKNVNYVERGINSGELNGIIKEAKRVFR